MALIALGQVFCSPRCPACTPAGEVMGAERECLLGVSGGFVGSGITGGLLLYIVLYLSDFLQWPGRVYLKCQNKLPVFTKGEFFPEGHFLEPLAPLVSAGLLSVSLASEGAKWQRHP